MSRILAIDYGNKRCGIAVSDPMRIIATPLETIPAATIISYLKNYTKAQQVQHIILGFPLDDANKATHATKGTLLLFAKLKKEFTAIKLSLVDERYTSKIAERAIRSIPMKKAKRHDKSLTDKVAATIMLQDYLNKFDHTI